MSKYSWLHLKESSITQLFNYTNYTIFLKIDKNKSVLTVRQCDKYDIVVQLHTIHYQFATIRISFICLISY